MCDENVEVSIIIPVYNKEKYIENTLDSVLNQSFTNYEVIIVNDGSTDNSFQILKDYEDKYPQVTVYSQENKGVSSARNLGLKKAEGKWIWFIDGDDVPSEHFLSEIFNSKIDKKIDIISSNYSTIDQNNNIKKIEVGNYRIITGSELVDYFMDYQYVNGYWGYLWNKLIRREFITNNYVEFREGLCLAEDLDFMVSLYEKCNYLCIVPYFSMQYTLEAENSSKDLNINYQHQLEIQKNIYKWIVIKNKKENYIQIFKEVISNYAACILFYSYERDEDINEQASSLINDVEIFDLLTCDNAKKEMKPIIRNLKSKNINNVYLYLSMRRKLKKIYYKIVGGNSFV